MYTLSSCDPSADLHTHVVSQTEALLTHERDGLAHMANLAALLYHTLPDLNWAGFYLRKGSSLVLGPFQGKPACTRIAWGAGVCGTAAARAQTVVVPWVHAFPGHIACDAASQAEIVVPLLRNGQVWGVLDLDSPLANRFTLSDQQTLEHVATLLTAAIDWEQPWAPFV